jgi:hypothetical protein
MDETGWEWDEWPPSPAGTYSRLGNAGGLRRPARPATALRRFFLVSPVQVREGDRTAEETTETGGEGEPRMDAVLTSLEAPFSGPETASSCLLLGAIGLTLSAVTAHVFCWHTELQDVRTDCL